MKLRNVTSLILLLSFVVMTYSGIVLFIVPQDKVAYWSNWKLLGLSKIQYGELHTTFMLLFVFFGVLHICFNWKSIINYLKDKSQKISFTKREFLIAVFINLFFFVGTLYYIQPFKTYFNFYEKVKNYWVKEYGEPPYGHAEADSLEKFCRKINMDVDLTYKILRNKNIIFDKGQTIIAIAKKNGISPKDLYDIIGHNISIHDTDIILKVGQKTLKELSDMKKIDLQKSIMYLKKQGITDVSKDSRIKEIAEKINKSPLETYKVLVRISRKGVDY